MNKIVHYFCRNNRCTRAAQSHEEEHRVRYPHTQRTRVVPLDTINALRIFSFPALRLVGHQQECMNLY